MFALYPTCQNLRPEVFARDNVLTRLMAWFYTCDTSTNVCPSLHVCGFLFSGYAWLMVYGLPVGARSFGRMKLQKY